ncbi:10259_t:CDS:2, partial [Racocetra persica]
IKETLQESGEAYKRKEAELQKVKEKKENNLDLLRNIGIMAHIDAGKTTTTERILYLDESEKKKIHKIAEVERSLRVLDGGIVVIDGKEGVEAQTETHVENRFIASCQSLEERLGANLLVVQFPLGGTHGIEGIVDLIEEKTYYFQRGDREENYQIV